MYAISTEAIRKLQQFEPQNLSNLSWSLATLRCRNSPLLEALASQARGTLTKGAVIPAQQKSLQHLGNIAWSFAVLIIRDQPLFDAIASEALPTLLWQGA